MDKCEFELIYCTVHRLHTSMSCVSITQPRHLSQRPLSMHKSNGAIQYVRKAVNVIFLIINETVRRRICHCGGLTCLLA
jgi:hypothetical protein